MGMVEKIRCMWGTWEELVLGGAVLRYGTRDWDVVASELRARTPFPYVFNAEVCEAKYHDLQQHYSSCKDLFEDLRKQRMAELKRSLEQSDDSIGSLQTKLQTLKTEGDHIHQPDYGSSENELPVPLSSSKETSKDGLSAGSFTQETRKKWSPQTQIPTASCGDTETKPENSASSEQGKASSVEMLNKTVGNQGVSITKKRGKRKRKESGKDTKEGSICESDVLGSTNTVSPSRLKDCSSGNDPVLVPSSLNESNQESSREKPDDLVAMFDSIVAYVYASIFCRRLDSQKRARYKRTIKQHMDLDTIRSRLDKGCITSVRELLRDLLLLSTNAVTFYSKNTREHKYAALLRGLVIKILRDRNKDHKDNQAFSNFTSFSNSPLSDPPVKPPGKPRSIRRRVSGKPVASMDAKPSPQAGRKPSKTSSSLPMEGGLSSIKKASSKQQKGGHGGTTRRAEALTKEKKKAR